MCCSTRGVCTSWDTLRPAPWTRSSGRCARHDTVEALRDARGDVRESGERRVRGKAWGKAQETAQETAREGREERRGEGEDREDGTGQKEQEGVRKVVRGRGLDRAKDSERAERMRWAEGGKESACRGG